MSGKPIPEAVAWPFSILEAGNWREVYMGTKHMRLEVSYPYEAWERLMAALAAAQQQGQAVACVCCEDKPAPGNNPCGWCGRTAPPSAPVGVEDVVMAARNAENAIRNCAAAGQIGEGYVQYADDLRDAVQRLAQQPAARPPKPTECMNGCPDRQVCDHCQWPPGPDQQPAAVNDLNARRAAFVAERAMRYREGGMAIEQARIHAETDAAHMEALAASQQPAAVDEEMVERAWVAFCENNGSARQGIRTALTAALATQRQEQKS